MRGNINIYLANGLLFYFLQEYENSKRWISLFVNDLLPKHILRLCIKSHFHLWSLQRRHVSITDGKEPEVQR
jgi:hypothetical protein